MLHKNKFIPFCVFIQILYLCSCSSREENREIEKISFLKIENEILKKTEYNFRKKIIKTINDSLTYWAKNKVQKYRFDSTLVEYLVDSTICINNKKDKIISSVIGRALKSNNKLDGITYFYGVKIMGNWYFFDGPIIQIPRNEKELGRPTSFEKLHEIALEEIFSGYLKQNKLTGKWEIDEAFFNDLTSGAWYKDGYKPKNQEEWNKRYLEIVADNWKHIDTTNYERLREEEMKKNK